MFTLNCQGRLLTIDKPVVMGILNLTPDSFFSPSRPDSSQQIREKVAQMVQEGATIIDVGAQSTRPGSEWLDAGQEWERLETILPDLVRHFPGTIFSVDTFHHQVAEKSVHAGASLVNDVSGGQLDPMMLETVGRLGVPFVCMHMKGTPQTMSSLASYTDLPLEVVDYFIQQIRSCREAGIKDIILDPGFGFAKKGAQNYALLNQLEQLQIFGCPILLGVSRKSMITKTLGISAEQALNGTTVLHTIGLLKGATILRVHDVREAMECIALVQAMVNAGSTQ